MVPNILSWLIFLPVIGAVLILLVPQSDSRKNLVKWIAAGFYRTTAHFSDLSVHQL